MIEMAQHGPILPPCIGLIGSGIGVVGGLVAAVSDEPGTGTAGLYVGVGGIIMGAATILGVLSDKFMPQMIALYKVKAENREENRKNAEARHRLNDELQAARAEIANLKHDADEAKRKANESENLAIRAQTELEVLRRDVRRNSRRVDALESGSGDALPTSSPPPSPGGPKP